MVDIDRSGPGGLRVGGNLRPGLLVVGVHRLPGADLHALDGEVRLGHRRGHLLPAGEVQRGHRQDLELLSAVCIQQGENVVGAVAADPQIQAAVELPVHRRVQEGPPVGAVLLCQGVVQPAGAPAKTHILRRRGAAELEALAIHALKDGGLLLEVLHRQDGEVGNRHLNRGAPPPGGDGDEPLARKTRGEVPHGVNGADVPLHRPGKCLRVRLQRLVLVSGGGGELSHGAGGGPQCGKGGAVGAADGQSIRRGDGVNRSGARPAAAAGGDGDRAAGEGRGQHIAVQVAAIGLQAVALLHGDKVGVHGGCGDVHLAARQHILVVRLNIEVTQLPGGLVGSHQKDLVGNLPLSPVGGTVGGIGLQLVRRGNCQRCGAAAVQAQGGDAAQFNHAFGHLIHGRTYGVS